MILLFNTNLNILFPFFGIIHGVCFSLESNLFWIFLCHFSSTDYWASKWSCNISMNIAVYFDIHSSWEETWNLGTNFIFDTTLCGCKCFSKNEKSLRIKFIWLYVLLSTIIELNGVKFCLSSWTFISWNYVSNPSNHPINISKKARYISVAASNAASRNYSI